VKWYERIYDGVELKEFDNLDLMGEFLGSEERGDVVSCLFRGVRVYWMSGVDRWLMVSGEGRELWTNSVKIVVDVLGEWGGEKEGNQLKLF